MRITAVPDAAARPTRARRSTPALVPLVGLLLVAVALRTAWAVDLPPVPDALAPAATTGSAHDPAPTAVLSAAVGRPSRPSTTVWGSAAGGVTIPTAGRDLLHPSPAGDPATIALSAQARLPDDLVARLTADPAILTATVVRAGIRDLVATWDAAGQPVDALPAGWRYPVEVLAVQPGGYAAILGVPEVLALQPAEALLSESSAVVRRLGVGARLRFADGTEVRVAGVLPDALLGAGEVVVTTASPLAPTWAAYVLATRADAGDEEVLGRFAAAGGVALVQVRGGEVPVLRHAPDLTAPARLKRIFGEFPVADAPGRWFQQGATWQAEALQRRTWPIIGAQTCHIRMLEPLTAALQELVDRGLDHLLDPSDVGGCWAPRVQGARTPSSHAWGISVDLNVRGNGMGATPTLAAEVVEVFTSYGFAWGGDWPVPDGMHLELVVDRPPGERWVPDADW
jgi:hypothetical protein